MTIEVAPLAPLLQVYEMNEAPGLYRDEPDGCGLCFHTTGREG